MSFEGRLGQSDSQLENMQLGQSGGGEDAILADAMSLTDTVGVIHQVSGNVQASTSLASISDSVVLAVTQGKPITHTLVLTDVAFSPRQIGQSVTDTLSVTDLAFVGVHYTFTDTLSISDYATTLRLPNLSVTDTLDLVDIAQIESREASAIDQLALTDTAVAIGPIYLTVTDKLTTTQSTFNPFTLAFQTFTGGLNDIAGVITVHSNMAVTDLMSFGQTASGVNAKASGKSASASDALSLTDLARLSIPLAVSDPLSLTDTASAIHGNQSAADALSLAQAVTLAISHAPDTVADPISIYDAAAFLLVQGCGRFTFAPQIGANSNPNAPTPPPSSLPAASSQTGFRLQYPATGTPTACVVLPRGPEFGNIDRFTADRINRESRGGTLIVYADPIWPKFHTLVLKISSLQKTDAYALRDFMAAYPGQQISLIDWENRAWSGVITNQQDPLIQDDRNSYTASFEFEGKRVA